MRILIVHNFLWAHYKSSVFQALQQVVDQRPGTSLMVLQIARNERSRAGLETQDSASAPTYRYTYELLFNRFVEAVSLHQRACALLSRTRAFRPDVLVLTGYYDPAQLLLLLWAKTTGIRVIMQNESTAADQVRTGWKERFKRWLLRQFDGFFCFGSQSANYLTGLGVPPDRILLRGNAVDNQALRTAYEAALPTRTRQLRALSLPPNNFVFVGRLATEKNLTALLKAFAESLVHSPEATDWGLILLGDGPERASLAEQVQAQQLGERVRILPGRPWFRVPEILALSNVLVLPSLSEPWGLVVNEAMACGLPVIVSNRCGCVPDLVTHGQTGYVFDPDQPVELARYLLAFIRSEVNGAAMQRAVQERIAAYTPEAIAGEMMAGFMKVMN